MMAAQGLDVLWILLFVSVIFLNLVVSGSKNGMYLVLCSVLLQIVCSRRLYHV